MGLTSGRVITTASAAFNLAGDPEDRSNFRKSVVISSVLSGRDSTIARSLSKAYLKGPGINLRRFHAWALDYYGLIGTPGEIKLKIETVIANDIRPVIQLDRLLPQPPAVQGIEIREADYHYWVEQYILDNHPDEMDTAWTYTINETTNEITIDFPNIADAVFTPVNFIKGEIYLYATYSAFGSLGIFIYRFGSGDPALDPLVQQELEGSDALFPIIPLRLDSQFISDSYLPNVYALTKRALKKSSGAKIEEIVDELADNPNIDDMEYAYVEFGAAANTQVQSQLEYIYRFLKDRAERVDEVIASGEYADYADEGGYNVGITDLNGWTAQSYEVLPGDENVGTDLGDNPGFIDISGSGPDGAPAKPYRGILISAPGSQDINYDRRIVWSALQTVAGVGLKKPDAKVGEYWFEASDEEFAYIIPARSTEKLYDSERRDPVVYMYHQETQHNWVGVKISGMAQRVFVFGRHYEELGLSDAIFETEAGQDSAFIFPLKLSLVEEMSLVSSTEMALHSQYLTIHTYDIYIQPFYASIAFRIFLIAVVIGITLATGGAGASSVGVLGSNAAVGTALGASAASAAVVGAIANMVAALVVSAIIQRGATALLGDKVGAIVGFLVAVATVNIMTNFAATGSFALNFGSMTTAESLLKLTSTGVDAYTRYLGAEVQSIVQEGKDIYSDYVEEMEKIQDLYAENIGYDKGVINPLELTDSSVFNPEPSQVFLDRTLMTGSDIAELSLSMLSNFTEISLSTDLPIP